MKVIENARRVLEYVNTIDLRADISTKYDAVYDSAYHVYTDGGCHEGYTLEDLVDWALYFVPLEIASREV